jgi:hypothetical protein
MQTYFTGVGIPHFTGRALAKLVFPLPPLPNNTASSPWPIRRIPHAGPAAPLGNRVKIPPLHLGECYYVSAAAFEIAAVPALS